MNLAIITTAIFVVIKVWYGFYGVRGNDYHSVVYFIGHYLMLVGIIRFMFLYSLTKKHRRFWTVLLVANFLILIFYLVCLFKPSLYKKLMVSEFVGIGTLVLITGILLIYIIDKLKQLKSHVTKNKRKANYNDI